MTQTMLRYNAGKPRLGLLPTSLILATAGDGAYSEMPLKLLNDTASVLTFGAQKYAPNNWRKSGSWVQVLDCALRHIHKLFAGETHDPESGIHHAAHAQCNIGFLLEFVAEHDGEDDRYPLKRKLPEVDDEPYLESVYDTLLIWKDGGDHPLLEVAAINLAMWYETLSDEERAIKNAS